MVLFMRNKLGIDYSYDGNIGYSKKSVLSALCEYFSHFLNMQKGQNGAKGLPKEKIREKSDKIIKIIIGSRKTRLGATPREENQREIQKRICFCLRQNIPIEVVMTWAPKKHLVVGEENAIDLNELVAIERLYDFHKRIEKIYPQGLHYNIYIEDFAGDYIEGMDQAIQGSIQKYKEGMMQMVNVLGIQKIFNIISINRFAENEGIYQEMVNRLGEIYPKLKSYWMESQEKGIEGYAKYKSYEDLQSLGWEGEIPQAMRDFYLDRAYNLYRDTISMEEKKLMVIRDLTAVMVTSEFNILRGDGEITPLKFSFVRPAPGIPKSRMKGRIDLRSILLDVTKKSIPPWSGKGYLAFKRGCIRPSMKSWREPINPIYKMIKGSLKLSRENLKVLIRADFLQSGH